MNHQIKGRYSFEQQGLLGKAYDLICIYFGSKEIFRRAEPDSTDEPLIILQSRFFEQKMSTLLIEIAASIRVLSDQVSKMDPADPYKQNFDKRMQSVKKLEYGIFDQMNLDLRETCNKIIHSDVLEFQTVEGIEAHENDIAFQQGMGSREIIWSHYRDHVRLAGTRSGQRLFVLLDIQVFVQAITILLE